MGGFTDEDWAAVSQELPTAEDAVIKQYLKGRQNLIAEEQKKRSGKCYPHVVDQHRRTLPYLFHTPC